MHDHMIIKRKSEKYTTTKIYFRKNKLRKACLEIMQLKGERIFRKVWKRTSEESKLEINIINNLVIISIKVQARGEYSHFKADKC